MNKRYFGTDGIRASVGTPPMTPDWLLRLGRALACVLPPSDKLVLIGEDPRQSSASLARAFAKGLALQGRSAVLLGVLPTPALAFMCRHRKPALAAVLSASHNPYQDNGIKFFSDTGFKLSDAEELEIERILDAIDEVEIAEQPGQIVEDKTAAQEYLAHCQNNFLKPEALSGLSLVLDCAEGATYQIAPALFRHLGAKVEILHASPNGININERCGATDLNDLKKAVLEQKADLGIAFDGDGDRLMMVDATGATVDGDELLWILAADRLAQGLPLAGVVGTLMSNLGLVEALADKQVVLYRAKVGDRYVLQALQERGWCLGGESSGHLLHLEYGSTGDGIASALLVLQAMLSAQQSLSQIKQGMFKYPQIMLNIRYSAGSIDLNHPSIQAAVKVVESELGPHGRVLLRASGTEPLVRVMVEGRDKAVVEAYAKELVAVIQKTAL